MWRIQVAEPSLMFFPLTLHYGPDLRGQDSGPGTQPSGTLRADSSLRGLKTGGVLGARGPREQRRCKGNTAGKSPGRGRGRMVASGGMST